MELLNTLNGLYSPRRVQQLHILFLAAPANGRPHGWVTFVVLALSPARESFKSLLEDSASLKTTDVLVHEFDVCKDI